MKFEIKILKLQLGLETKLYNVNSNFELIEYMEPLVHHIIMSTILGSLEIGGLPANDYDCY